MAPRRLEGRMGEYFEEIDAFVISHVPPGSSILDLGCGTGNLLRRLAPAKGLGLDLSPRQIEIARRAGGGPYEVQDIEDAEGMERLARTHGTFDRILLVNVLGELGDIWGAFRTIAPFCHDRTRLVILYDNFLWEPLLAIGRRMGLRAPPCPLNWLPRGEILDFLELNDFEAVETGNRILSPLGVPLLARGANGFLARLPVFDRLGLVEFAVARPLASASSRARQERTVSVVIPCRNEKENIRPAVARIPHMGRHTEILFVDGESTDGTGEEIRRVIEEEKGNKEIRLLLQRPNRGKGDALRMGFAAAEGEILMSLDADLTADPADLPKFYAMLVEGRAEVATGNRLVYPTPSRRLRLLHILANNFFGRIFSWLLGQKIRDTLCGTKVLFREDWLRLAAARAEFGDFDPYGDFEILFGAARASLRLREIPVRYHERARGETKIGFWIHLRLLVGMTFFAFRRLRLR